LPFYALDAVRFLERHAIGHDSHSDDRWRLEPRVATESRDHDLFGFPSRGFKKEFTQQMRKMFVVATAPDASRVLHYDEVVANGGTNFLFVFNRCYLSESWDEYLTMSTIDPTAPTYDLMSEFQFTGDFLVRGRSENRYIPLEADHIARNLIHNLEEWRVARAAGEVGFVGGKIPAEWVTGVVEFDWSEPSKLLPIPIWEAELDNSKR